MLQINLLDVAVVVILLAFIGNGLFRGLIKEVTGLVGVVTGFALARHFQPQVQPSIEAIVPSPNTAGIVSYILIFVIAVTCVALSALALRKVMSITLTAWVDHLLGAVAGLAKGLLITSVIFFLLQGLFPDLPLLESAAATPFFNILTEYLRNFLPKVFASNPSFVYYYEP